MKNAKTQNSESPLRSIVKSLSWRILATLTTILIAYAITKEIAVSLGIGGIEVFAKMFLYYMHERAWNKINYGRNKKPC